MSDDRTQIIHQVEKEKFVHRLQRFFEDWWPVLVVSFGAVLVGLVATLVVRNIEPATDPYEFCAKAQGHLVQTGVENQLACVDKDWKLVTP